MIRKHHFHVDSVSQHDRRRVEIEIEEILATLAPNNPTKTVNRKKKEE